MIRKKFYLLFPLAALFLSGYVWPAYATSLYEVEVPVADQSDSNRLAALAEALRDVVVKVSGNSAAGDTPATKEALKNPTRYVEQYSYKANESAGTELPMLMNVTFDKGRIDHLLQSMGMPRWGANNRPLTIVWLAVEQGNQKILVGVGDHGLIKGLLESDAQLRGLPLRLPLLDSTDQIRVKPEDVWNDNHNSIIQASQRYEAQAVLTGSLAMVGGRWQVRWTLYKGETMWRWIQSGDKVEPLVAYGIDAATDSLANSLQASPMAAEKSEFHLVVKDVRDMHDNRRVIDYLASLRGVTNVQLEQVDSDSVRVAIITHDGEAILQQLGFDNRLLPLDARTPVAELAEPADRVYRLVQ